MFNDWTNGPALIDQFDRVWFFKWIFIFEMLNLTLSNTILALLFNANDVIMKYSNVWWMRFFFRSLNNGAESIWWRLFFISLLSLLTCRSLNSLTDEIWTRIRGTRLSSICSNYYYFYGLLAVMRISIESFIFIQG